MLCDATHSKPVRIYLWIIYLFVDFRLMPFHFGRSYTDPNTTIKTSCCSVLLAVRQKTNFHGKDSFIAYHFITSILVTAWCKIIKQSTAEDVTFWPSYSWTSDLHWFRVTFTCESKMTKAGIDLVKQWQWQVHILCLTDRAICGFYIYRHRVGNQNAWMRFKGLYKWSSERAHLISSHVYLSLMCWWIGAVRACFLTTIPSCGGYFLRLVCSRFFVSMDKACAAKSRYWLDCEM